METQDGQMQVLPLAQRELARLSQQVRSSDTPGQSATGLLEQLLHLSGAEHGAILLTTRHNAPAPWSAPAEAWNVLALSGMIEGDALALLATLPPNNDDMQSPLQKPYWLVWHFSLPLPSSIDAEQTTALVVLGWPEHADEELCRTSIKRTSALLRDLSDSVRAVIANILLAERLHELEMAWQRKEVREMELLKAELLATVSHELRSPLASIKGYAATLLRHDHHISREERHEFLLAINESSERLARVIDRLLEMSQLDTDSVELQCAPINLAYLVREAITSLELRLLEPPLSHRHFTLRLRQEDEHSNVTGEELIVSADRQLLREVLDNLLENAVNYSPEGGLIEVTLRPVLPERYSSEGALQERTWTWKRLPPVAPTHEKMVEIRVSDPGVGIPPEHLERIFDRFHRVDTRLIREVDGLGLGLAICKRIIQLHGGTIWAESILDQGSVFSIWLPI